MITKQPTNLIIKILQQFNNSQGQNSLYNMAYFNVMGQNSHLIMSQECNNKGQINKSFKLQKHTNSIYKELETTTVNSHDKTVTKCSMVAPPNNGRNTAGKRMKRENCKLTKHDPIFSDWKKLIGSSDWENHSLGKEGAEKYRTQNLPSALSHPGAYELGIDLSGSDTKARKLGSSSVCVVYVGQSDNVRTRLQQYGREGAHLGHELFSKIFSMGYGIAYRWAEMKSKKAAELAEKQLLNKFDYAWNKDGNGSRRENDILEFLENHATGSLFSRIKKLLSNKKKKVGTSRTREPHTTKNGSKSPKTKNYFIFSSKIGIKRVQPPVPCYKNDESADICGVTVGNGSICNTTPVKGRKRCLEHKGLRVNGCISKLNTEGKVLPFSSSIGNGAAQGHVIIQNERLNHTCANADNKNSAPICGVKLEDGTPCKSKPFQRNKRCLQHKGKRILKSELNFVNEN